MCALYSFNEKKLLPPKRSLSPHFPPSLPSHPKAADGDPGGDKDDYRGGGGKFGRGGRDSDQDEVVGSYGLLAILGSGCLAR